MEASDAAGMNSRAFWEDYFDAAWDANDGGGQTRHFMRHLLAGLPPQVMAWLVGRPLEVLDWGCAHGEGAALLAQTLPDAVVRGLDFSLNAVEEARRRHPEVEFLWTEDGTIPEQHDVIVTSNCLEHFEEPLEVLRGHLAHCRSVYIAMVPYKEAPLHEQHFAQFRKESFPEDVDGWRRVALTPFAVDNAYWPGQQVIAVYAASGTAADLLKEKDVHPAVRGLAAVHRGTVPQEVTAVEQRNELASASRELRDARQELEQLRQVAVELERQRAATDDAQRSAARLRADVEQLRREADARRREAQDRAREVDRLAGQVAQSTRLLQREELSLVRPVARRLIRTGRSLGRRLSPQQQDRVRATLAPAVARLAPRSTQAAVYARSRELRHGAEPTLLPVPDRDEGKRQLPPASRDDAFDVVVLPVIDWEFRHQRPQQLSTHLSARGHRVLYLTTTFDRPRLGAAPVTLLRQVEPSVFTGRLVCPDPQPVIYQDRLDDYQAAVVADALRGAVRELGLQRVVLLAQHPFWGDVCRRLPEHVLVYDLMDDHEGFDNTAGWVLDAERELLGQVDLTTVTAPTLQQKVPGRSVLVRNGAEVERFAAAAERRAARSSDAALTVGYVGAIAHWFDTALVRRCALAHPDWRFVLVGDTTGSDAAALDDLDNVELLGERPYTEVPDLVASFDVCLIPFHVIPLTTHTNPVKAYEYLSAGKPVVATAMPEVVLMAPHVHVAEDHENFLEALERAASEVGDETLASQRQDWAAEHSWAARADTLEGALVDLQPEVSVIVLCYGNLDLTRQCVESLERHTRYLRWELVLVDNASPDETRAWLREYAADRPHVVVVENDDNLGFAGGNNAGVRASSGEVVVLLNNDTYVTDGWLHSLVRHLRDDDRVGLVGPVTNNIGNEARIDVHYADMGEMAARAVEYTGPRLRMRMLTETVAFFCVALRRSVWDDVGELDERFGLGFFEDDDYCRRVRQAGLDVVIAEDVFVHHHLSASFDGLGSAHKQALFERNRRLFEEKWGNWAPHTARVAVT